MKKKIFNNIVWKENKNYVSWNINTGISSFGSTKKKAIESLKEALELYFEDMPLSKAIKVERPKVTYFCLENAKAN